jgi:hypothetical protein
VKFGFIAKYREIWPAEWLCGALPASMPAISQRRPETDAASERFAIMAEHSTSVLIENSIQIAWDFLERSGEIENPVIAS